MSETAEGINRLLSEIGRLERQLVRLAGYVQHRQSCMSLVGDLTGYDGNCSCGLDDALACKGSSTIVTDAGTESRL